METEEKVYMWRSRIRLIYDEFDKLDKKEIAYQAPEMISMPKEFLSDKPLDVPLAIWDKENDLLYILALTREMVVGFAIGFLDGIMGEKLYALENKIVNDFGRTT